MIQGLEFHIISMKIHTSHRLAKLMQNISHNKDSGTTNARLKKPMVIQCLFGININMKPRWNFGHLI